MNRRAYKVVKKTGNKRVSVIVPDWNPLYRVYSEGSKINIIDNGFVFYDYEHARAWFSIQKLQLCGIHADLKEGEELELWSVWYDKNLHDQKVFEAYNLINEADFNICIKPFLKNNCDFWEMIKNNQDSDIMSGQVYGAFVASNIQLKANLKCL